MEVVVRPINENMTAVLQSAIDECFLQGGGRIVLENGEYRIGGMQMFEDMVSDIRDTTARRVLSVMPREKVERVQTAKPLMAGEGGKNATVRGATLRTQGGVKIGRNSPCPCGSGKRYKRCCGAGKDEE